MNKRSSWRISKSNSVGKSNVSFASCQNAAGKITLDSKHTHSLLTITVQKPGRKEYTY